MPSHLHQEWSWANHEDAEPYAVACTVEGFIVAATNLGLVAFESPPTAHAAVPSLSSNMRAVRLIPSGAFWPDHLNRYALLSGIGDDIGCPAVSARWCTVPHGQEQVRPVDDELPGRHVSFLGRLDERKRLYVTGAGEELIVLRLCLWTEATPVPLGGDDDLKLVTQGQHGMGEELIGAVRKAGYPDNVVPTSEEHVM